MEDTYKELQSIVLRSYSLSEHQKIIKWLDHPGLGAIKPSVLMDLLNTLQPSFIVEVQKILFLRKMPAYIRDMIKPEGFPGSARPHRPMQRDLGEQEPRPGRRHRRSGDSTAALPSPATAGRPRPPPPQTAAATATGICLVMRLTAKVALILRNHYQAMGASA